MDPSRKVSGTGYGYGSRKLRAANNARLSRTSETGYARRKGCTAQNIRHLTSRPQHMQSGIILFRVNKTKTPPADLLTRLESTSGKQSTPKASNHMCDRHKQMCNQHSAQTPDASSSKQQLPHHLPVCCAIGACCCSSWKKNLRCTPLISRT